MIIDTRGLPAWSFVERYYPDYYNCPQIKFINDLYAIVNGNYKEGDDSHVLINERYDGNNRNYLIPLHLMEAMVKAYDISITKYQESYEKDNTGAGNHHYGL